MSEILPLNSPESKPPAQISPGDTCPACGIGQATERHGKHGKFFGCSTFPQCRWTASISESESRGGNASHALELARQLAEELERMEQPQ